MRTLHHYDALGLVRPSERTQAGHRRYLPRDVEQLYRVQALRALDLSLRQIADLFARDGTRALRISWLVSSELFGTGSSKNIGCSRTWNICTGVCATTGMTQPT